MSQDFHGTPPPLMLVRFEQGRGQTGVPKVWLPVLTDTGRGAWTIETLLRMIVSLFRAMCCDPSNHGRDLMPGVDESEYELHLIDGMRVTKTEMLRWETITVGNVAYQRTEVVLTWRSPADLLVRASRPIAAT